MNQNLWLTQTIELKKRRELTGKTPKIVEYFLKNLPKCMESYIQKIGVTSPYVKYRKRKAGDY